jgi:5'-3' exoribonuclease 1
MGIPGLFGRWLQRRIPYAITKKIPPYVSSLSIDFNALIHEVNNDIKGSGPYDDYEKVLSQKVMEKVLDLVKKIDPIDVLILAVDGVPPSSKIKQQRDRRFKKSLEPHEGFDTNAITPGTEFMFKLDKKLKRELSKYKNVLPPNVIFSGHDVRGEGEHKIMDIYRDESFWKNKVAHNNGATHILIGLDADLIMLSLMTPLKRLYLYRESFDQKIKEKSIDLVIVDLMRSEIRKRFVPNIDDFIVISMFIGNDFIPKSPSINDVGRNLDILIDVLKRKGLKLINDHNQINRKSMYEYVKELANIEPEMAEDYDAMQSIWKDKIKQYTDNTDKMCTRYIDMFDWCYSYYSIGNSKVNQIFSYDYYYAPTFKMLYESLKNVNYKESQTPDYINDLTYKYNMMEQLAAVIPSKSKDIIDKKLRIIYCVDSLLYDLYPEVFELDGEYKRAEHEAVALIPFVDYNRVKDAMSMIPLSTKEYSKYLEGEDKIIRTPVKPHDIRSYKNRLAKYLNPGKDQFIIKR